MRPISYFIHNPYQLVERIALMVPGAFSDKCFLKILFRSRAGYKLNLKNPITFNEKLQWIKLYDHNPQYTTMVDKHSVKKYVADIIGEEYIIPTLGVWDKPEDIDWESLPRQFVLKCTHDSGGLVICKDKALLNKEKAIEKLGKSLQYNFYLAAREWPYKNVPRRIIAEEYKEDEFGELRDYKFFCFDGEVKALFIATDRQSREEPYFDFFDADFNHLPMRHGHPNAPTLPQKPRSFEKMKELAAKLSKGMAEARIDFYDVNGHPYFGEITLFHHTGMVPFEPKKWDEIFGSWIKLP